ncbi:MAG TPA: SDR family oxidoreductase [Gemmatimonadales bacterium]|nr:SDR family oxidoreductase [Gemmatimonadales bacterium]
MSIHPLEGRVALVSGAGHGIGAATAAELARLGAAVALTDRPGRDLEPLGPRSFAVEADLTDPASPRHIFDAAEAALGPVEILVNNASAGGHDSFVDGGADAVGRTAPLLSASTVGPLLLVDAQASALMIAELAAVVRRHQLAWGRVISLTSGGPSGFPGEVSYGAAKAALDNVHMSASIELAPLGITANVVHPPVTDTGWVTDEVRAFVARSTDHVHVADPTEVAAFIGWLCTDESRLLTGNVLRLR